MTHLDLFPALFRRPLGLDVGRFFDAPDEILGARPAYDITRQGDNAYRITLSVPGFAEKDLKLEARENILIVEGAREETPAKKKDEEGGEAYLHQGIARRAFSKSFHLADHVRVVDAKLAQGLLEINLEREIPEEMKPKRIAITAQ